MLIVYVYLELSRTNSVRNCRWSSYFYRNFPYLLPNLLHFIFCSLNLMTGPISFSEVVCTLNNLKLFFFTEVFYYKNSRFYCLYFFLHYYFLSFKIIIVYNDWIIFGFLSITNFVSIIIFVR